LFKSAQCTCFIGVNPGPNGRGPISGTAFFVSETILLTAGHMARDDNRRIVSQLPGTFEARLFVDQLFENNPEIETFECEVVGTGLPDVDICVLRVKGDFRAKHYLEIKQKPVKHGDAVDVIGYPGRYDERYIQRMHGGAIDRDAIRAVTELFPKCELIVSHGLVDSDGNMPTYYLSTVVGMSGSPVIISGGVVGR
jgi:Trypsin-like peptidase domain